MEKKHTKKLNLEKLKIAKLDNLHAIKGGTSWIICQFLQSLIPAECQNSAAPTCHTNACPTRIPTHCI